MEEESRKEALKKITFEGLLLNVALVFLKFLAGFLSGAQVIIADALHSLSDFISDAFVFLGIKISSKPPDDTHHYGHYRFENLFTIIVGLVLIGAASFLIYEALNSIITKEYLEREKLWLAFIVALFSVISKEYIFRETLKIGKEFNSEMIIANAWHHRSDSFSSIAALIGIIATIANLKIADPVSAIIVSIIIMRIGIKLIVKNTNALMDMAIDKKTLESIAESIKSIPEVIEYHNLKARYVGPYIYCEFHILVDPNLSIKEAHEISHTVKDKIMEKIKNIKDIQIHIEPYSKN